MTPQSQASRLERLEQQYSDLEKRMVVVEQEIIENKGIVGHLSKVVEGFETLSQTVRDLDHTISAFLKVLKWFAGIGGGAAGMVLGYWLLQALHIIHP